MSQPDIALEELDNTLRRIANALERCVEILNDIRRGVDEMAEPERHQQRKARNV